MSYLEPRTLALAPDAEPMEAEQSASYWREDAVTGSRALLKALFKSIGADITTVTIPTPEGVPAKEIEACACCGSPVGPNLAVIANIQATVAAYYQIPALMMVSEQKAKRYAHPRQIAMYLASAVTGKSLPDIGKRFGNRDHTTVIHAIKQVKKRIATDPEIAADVETLRARIVGL